MEEQTVKMATLYAWGNSQNGQLGYGGSENMNQPTKIESFNKQQIISLSTGSSHSLYVDENGIISSFGNNDYGQLGHNKRRQRPETIDSLNVFQIKQVAAGSTHSLALTNDGQILSWGTGERGQLGLGLEFLNEISKPKFIKLSEKIVQIACGTKHCLALSENGNIWAWGDNSQGQLGIGTFVLAHTPTLVTALQGRPIKKIVCGGSHSIALSYSGHAYVWGDNTFGQLGTGDTTKLLRPQILKTITSKIMDITCGENHTLALLIDGKVFSFGSGSNGQLGHQGTNHEYFPKAIENLLSEPVSMIACGRRHSLAYQPKSKKLYSWGLNGSGQLGHLVGGEKGTSSPFSIKTLENENIISIFCGGDQSFAFVIPNSESLPSPSPLPRLEISKLTKPIIKYLLDNAQISGNYGTLQHYVEIAFSSISCLNSSFLSFNHYETSVKKLGVDLEEVEETYDLLFRSQNQLIVNTIGNATARLVKSLVNFHTGQPECMRVFIILLHNPLFQEPSVYHVVCQTLATLFVGLSDKIRDVLTEWFKRLSPTNFFRIVQVFQRFLSFLMSDKQLTLDASVTSCAINLKWLNSINNEARIIPYRLFYNHEVSKKIDVKEDYQLWLTQKNQFSFCQYPFLLDMGTKTSILNIDAQRQMTNEVNNYLFQTLSASLLPFQNFFYQNQNPNQDQDQNSTQDPNPNPNSDPQIIDQDNQNMDQNQNQNQNAQNGEQHILNLTNPNNDPNVEPPTMSVQVQLTQDGQPHTLRIDANPFLVLKVRRGHLLQDSLNQIMKCKPQDFKRPLTVKFEGEEGQDDGGLRKEFFNLITQAILDPNSGLFTYDEEMRQLWFNNSQALDSTYKFIGILFGLAIYNSCLLDLPFPLILYKKLLGLTPTLDDLKEFQPTVGKSLQTILDYDGDDLEEIFGLNFQIQQRINDQFVNIDLKPNGENIHVTQNNKAEFVQLYVNYILVDSIKTQFKAFYDGFTSVCSGPVFQLFHSSELEILVRGSPNYNFYELEPVTTYGGSYNKDHPVIRNFWKVFHSMSTDLKKKFLIFVSGSDKIPVIGLGSLKFVINETKDVNRLPAAHTCFNILDLPCYNSITTLQEKLVYAITNTEGFGLI